MIKTFTYIKSVSIIFIYFISSLFNISFGGSNTNTLLNELELTIKNRKTYQNEKLNSINDLKHELRIAKKMENKELEFDLNFKLYEEYQSFIYDSANKYITNLTSLAHELNDPEKINMTKIEMGFTFLSSGLFKEALDTLLQLKTRELNKKTKIDYYLVLSRTYYDLSDYHSQGDYTTIYIKKGNDMLDSALQNLSDSTAQFWLALGLRNMKAENFTAAADAFNYVLSQFEISEHDYAICTSSLGWVYTLLNRENDATDMLIKASIADIKSSTKETVALRNLAILLYKKSDLDRAFRFINIALEDATFYNARHRKLEISEILPIIEGKRLDTLEKQRKQLINYGVATTGLSVLVTLFALIIYKQLKRLKSIRRILQETNSNLQAMNETLLEANKIKEEYIGYFFNINSEFIDQLESVQKTIRRKVTSRQFDDLNDIIKSTDLHKERENLFRNFDRIFLKIFPHFIDEFNKFFLEEDQIVPENDELLNTDLRIYALIRLGITDNEKIARFLNYSVNTIYTYKTKLKHKTIVPKDAFENRIMAIKAI